MRKGQGNMADGEWGAALGQDGGGSAQQRRTSFDLRSPVPSFANSSRLASYPATAALYSARQLSSVSLSSRWLTRSCPSADDFCGRDTHRAGECQPGLWRLKRQR